MDYKVQVSGLDKLEAKLQQFPQTISKNLGAAGKESAESVIFPTEGIQVYPPATSPTYIRGRGTQHTFYNDYKSERYGTQFYSRVDGATTYIGNRASYAQWLTDENKQSPVMANKGWKKLVVVVSEKLSEIKAVYQEWVNKTIQELGL